MPEVNPYAPPESKPDRPTSRRHWAIVLRVLAVVAGFSMVADPTFLRLLPDHRAVQIVTRLVGACLLIAAFLPWQREGENRPDVESQVEDL